MCYSIRVAMLLAVMCLCSAVSRAQLAPTAFTYQGELKQNGQAASTVVAMQFRLYDALSGGSQIGPTVSLPGVDVMDGLFSVALDFGAIASSSDQLWLEITVGGFVMSPREAITASPYSLQTRGIHVDSAGDVGIGTTGPGADLEVREGDASIRVRSTNGVSTARVELMGALPSAAGGIYSSLDFLDETASSQFRIQHDSAFLTEYLSLFTPDNANALLRISEDRMIAFRDIPSIAPLHITDRDIGLYNDGMLNETLALEDNDAVLGIYSSNTGSWGSAIVLGEVVSNQLVNKWGLARTTSNASPELRMTFGTGANYAQNPTVFKFTPGGLEFPDGSIQAAATGSDYAVRLAGELFSSRGQISGPFFPDTVTIEITQPGQRILVNGIATMRFQNGRGFEYRIAYRLAGTGDPLSYATQRMVYSIGSNDIGEIHTVPTTTIIDGLTPGTYEIGFLFDDITDYGTPTYVGQQLTALTF